LPDDLLAQKPFSEREPVGPPEFRAILRRTQGIKGNQQNDLGVIAISSLSWPINEAYCNGDYGFDQYRVRATGTTFLNFSPGLCIKLQQELIKPEWFR